jgi:tRNA modification GTPase
VSGNPRDTIAAIATPRGGGGGIGIVRLSGPRAAEIVAAMLGRGAEALVDRRLEHGVARAAGGEPLDEVLAVVMRGPRSYTGEDVAEIHGHGGPLNLARLLEAVIARGARAAEPGEFTRRAFESGRLDLTRAEAVADVIGAASERALRVAQAQLAGALGRRVASLRQQAVSLLAEVEASIDFPGEDLDFPPAAEVAARSAALAAAAGALAGTYRVGRALRDGVVVALVGAPNVGKSSLLNALCGEERAVVTAEPGTTRDYVEATAVWDGVSVTLVDTAGERAGALSQAERRGLELGQARAQRADLVVRVREVGEAAGEAGRGEELVVWNKVDLGPAPAGELAVSARSGEGLDGLVRAILARVVGEGGEGAEGEVVTSERQRALVAEAAQAAERAAAAAAEGRPAELVASDLRQAARALGQVSGEEVGEAVLDALFERFCLGK